MFIVQIIFLVLCLVNNGVLQQPPQQNINMDYCSNDWLEMNDQNFAETVDRYKQCLDYSKLLNKDDRRRYQSKMAENLVTSCKEFLQNTSLPPKDLVRAVRNIVRILEPYVDEASHDEDEDMWDQGMKKNENISEDFQPRITSKPKRLSNTTRYKVVAVEFAGSVNNKKYYTTTNPMTTTSKGTTRYAFVNDVCSVDQDVMAKNCLAKRNATLLLYAFMTLILIQMLLLLCLLCKCMMFFHSWNQEPPEILCQTNYDASCRNYDINWMEQGHAMQVRSESEATPSTSVENTVSKTKHKKIKYTTEVSSISSSDLGSDSEFEALMKRRPLLEKKHKTPK